MITRRQAPLRCDRYGHPVGAVEVAPGWDALSRYLQSHGFEVRRRWSTLYRQLYEQADPSEAVPNADLHEAIDALLCELSLCDPESQECGALLRQPDSLRLLQRLSLAGWDCAGYLLPSEDWEDPDELHRVREELRDRLYRLSPV